MSHTEQMREALEEARDLLEKKAGERGHGCSHTARELHPAAFARIDAALTAPAADVPEAMGDVEIDRIANANSVGRGTGAVWPHAFAKDLLKARDAQWQSTRLRGGVPGWQWVPVEPTPEMLAAAPQAPALDADGKDHQIGLLIAAVGKAAQAQGIYNGQVPLSGPLALMLLDDMATTAALDAGVVRWGPLTPARLSSEEFDGLYWLALKGGDVVAGEYEWRQGWSPDGFNTQEQGRVSAGDVTHIARFERPKPPAIEAAMSAQGATQAERDQAKHKDTP